jgi:hypothetical protein
LRQVVDSPLICGQNFRDFDLKGKQTPPLVMHVTSESPTAIQFDDKLVCRYRALAPKRSLSSVLRIFRLSLSRGLQRRSSE